MDGIGRPGDERVDTNSSLDLYASLWLRDGEQNARRRAHQMRGIQRQPSSKKGPQPAGDVACNALVGEPPTRGWKSLQQGWGNGDMVRGARTPGAFEQGTAANGGQYRRLGTAWGCQTRAGSVRTPGNISGLPFRYVARRLHSASARGPPILRAQAQEVSRAIVRQ